MALIGMEPVLEILRTVVMSGYVKAERPVSILLIALPDSGKSEAIMHYFTPQIKVMSDFTAKGLLRIVQGQAEKRTFIIAPDLNMVISHKPSVANLTFGCLLSLLQEGTMKISDGGGENEYKGARIGFAAAITPSVLSGKAGRWRGTGLLRRLLPVYYDLSDDTINKVHLQIREGNYKADGEIVNLKCPAEPMIVVIPKDIRQKVDELCRLVSNERLEPRGFSPHKHFRCYVKARALIHGRNKVIDQDFQDLKRATEFFRLDRGRQI
jgi:hypothetical protein